MAASNPCGDITDMDCSPAELEEFTKEVWLPRISDHIKTVFLYPPLLLPLC